MTSSQMYSWASMHAFRSYLVAIRRLLSSCSHSAACGSDHFLSASACSTQSRPIRGARSRRETQMRLHGYSILGTLLISLAVAQPALAEHGATGGERAAKSKKSKKKSDQPASSSTTGSDKDKSTDTSTTAPAPS